MSLLFDALLHPDADLGSNSPPLLEWEYMPELQIDHVVLGKGMLFIVLEQTKPFFYILVENAFY